MITLIQLLVVLVVVGLLLYLVNSLLPVPPPFKQAINAIVIVVLCIWLLGSVGLWIGGLRWGR